ncbi:MAG: sn-glycerol-3-phosphate ABC transporter ATP-binding protein UgpC [Candidatus Brocadiae bacterium]|nr:sn-glycerol-3-phosphate ABC transporter ATP-binding protein UgpC [Candidatus Brocadiia bacterium]
MAGVIFKNVYKIYENKTMVIQNFDLEIRDKEFLVLVGPSGCGKSTTLRMIAGLEEVSRGDLMIDGLRVNDVAPKDRDIAMVFQNYALYPHMSVKENMAFSLKLRGVDRNEIEKKVLEVSEILGLKDLLERKPKQLSGGQRQRVAMGRAIVRSPKVFLFDEPLSNLDAKLRVQMRVEIAKLHKLLGTTIVYVTHDQVEAMTLADRIVVMKDGFIQQIGTPLELYEKPANAFVGGFIGSPSMNQIAAKVGTEKGQIVLQGQDFLVSLSGEKAKALESHKGEDVLMGIRPQNIHPQPDAQGKVAVLREVEVIEPMGTESYIYFTMSKDADRTWVARCDGMPQVQEGQKAAMVFDIDKVHIFSKDGSKRLA